MKQICVIFLFCLCVEFCIGSLFIGNKIRFSSNRDSDEPNDPAKRDKRCIASSGCGCPQPCYAPQCVCECPTTAAPAPPDPCSGSGDGSSGGTTAAADDAEDEEEYCEWDDTHWRLACGSPAKCGFDQYTITWDCS